MPELEKTIDRVQQKVRTVLGPEETEAHTKAVENLTAMIRTQTRRIEKQVAAIKRAGAAGATTRKKAE